MIGGTGQDRNPDNRKGNKKEARFEDEMGENKASIHQLLNRSLGMAKSDGRCLCHCEKLYIKENEFNKIFTLFHGVLERVPKSTGPNGCVISQSLHVF